MRRWAVLRGLLLLAVVLSVSATEEAAEPTEPEPVPAEGAAAEEPVPEEPEIVLNCNANGVLPRLQLASVTLPSPALLRTGRAARQGRDVERRLRRAVAREPRLPCAARPHRPQPRVPGRARTARSSLTRVSNGSMCSRTRTLHRAHPPACAGDLKTPFMGNKVDGAALAQEPSLSKLEP